MSDTSHGGPAFPRPYSHDAFNDDTCPSQTGISLRDYLAAHAPPAPPFQGGNLADRAAEVANWALRYADAVLAARSKK